MTHHDRNGSISGLSSEKFQDLGILSNIVEPAAFALATLPGFSGSFTFLALINFLGSLLDFSSSLDFCFGLRHIIYF